MIFALALAIACTATDGDTIRCGAERIRLIGIDAPEMGRCPPRRRCVPGDPVASRDHLARLLERRPIRIERTGRDRYGRTLALVSAGGVDLSCAQVRAGRARYVPRWDEGGRVASICRSSGVLSSRQRDTSGIG